MKNLLTQVTLDRSARKKDRSVSMTFVTQLESSSEEFMNIDNLCNTSGTLYYKPNGSLTQEEIDEIGKADIKVEGKSKSQMLRNVLYVYCEQEGKDFKEFYASEMEKIRQHYLDKLD